MNDRPTDPTRNNLLSPTRSSSLLSTEHNPPYKHASVSGTPHTRRTDVTPSCTTSPLHRLRAQAEPTALSRQLPLSLSCCRSTFLSLSHTHSTWTSTERAQGRVRTHLLRDGLDAAGRGRCCRHARKQNAAAAPTRCGSRVTLPATFLLSSGHRQTRPCRAGAL